MMKPHGRQHIIDIERDQLRAQARNNPPTLLVFAPIFGLTSTGTYPENAPADVPCGPTQIRRNPVKLFLACALKGAEPF
jgi:hypothetical protein